MRRSDLPLDEEIASLPLEASVRNATPCGPLGRRAER